MAEELLAVDQNGNTYNTKNFITSNHINNSKRQSINGKEFDTYKVSTVANSCSTMHKIQEKKFTIEDFSTDKIIDTGEPGYENVYNDLTLTLHYDGEKQYYDPHDIFSEILIPALNLYRKRYLETKDKKYWWQMIQLLPSSYNQTRNVMINYEVLANIYKSRKDHKLDEWREFCKWIEALPYSELITESCKKTEDPGISKEQWSKMIDILIEKIDDPTMCDTSDMECWLNEQREKYIRRN